MDYRRVDRGHVAVAGAVLFALASMAGAVQSHSDAAPAYVDPVFRQSLAAGGLQPAILVVEAPRFSASMAALDDLGLESRAYSALSMVGTLLDASLLEAVAKTPGVTTIYRNERMRPLLDRSADYVGAKAVWNTYDVTGAGVTVLVMDSGIDAGHPDLPYRSKVVANVVPDRRTNGLVAGSREGVPSSDSDGHGTHVAGILAGTGAGAGAREAGKFRGIAPGARLVGYQAGLPDDRTGDIEFESLTVLEGFNWALENREKYGLDIVSNSWGANGEFDPRSPVNIATLNLYKAGLLVLFAAGNEGGEGKHTLNKYSVAPWVLSVTAGDYFNQIPDFASRGTDHERAPYDHPDLAAPGVGITAARSQRSSLAPTSNSQLYATKSGSSMATPHVAGIAALLLEANPRLSPDDLMDLLTESATPVSRSPAWESGAGYVNGLRAYQMAVKAAGHREAFLSGKVKYAGPASGDADFSEDAVTVGYLKGAASRLRSPDTSIPAVVRELFVTPAGLAFLLGGAALGLLAFGPSRPPAPKVPSPAARPSPGAQGSIDVAPPRPVAARLPSPVLMAPAAHRPVGMRAQMPRGAQAPGRLAGGDRGTGHLDRPR